MAETPYTAYSYEKGPLWRHGTALRRHRPGPGRSRRYTPEVADLAASGRLDAHAVTTMVADRDDAPAAWLAPATKLVLVRN